MTFRTFATPDEVFDLLVERYETIPPTDLADTELEEWKEKKLIPLQSRVLIVFTMWLQDYGLLDEEPHIAGRLVTFLTLIVSPSSLMLTAKLILRDLERSVRFSIPGIFLQPENAYRRFHGRALR
jgi:son of sevenless